VPSAIARIGNEPPTAAVPAAINIPLIKSLRRIRHLAFDWTFFWPLCLKDCTRVQINFGEAITLFAVIQAYFFIVGLLSQKSPTH
jgi:hypothetical protein